MKEEAEAQGMTLEGYIRSKAAEEESLREAGELLRLIQERGR